MRHALGWIGTFGVGGAIAAAGGCATSAVVQQELTKTNTQTVLAFEETVFNKHEVPEAFAHYVGPDFVEHDVHLGGAVETTADETASGKPVRQGDPPRPLAAPKAYAALIARLGPRSQRVVLRTIAQGDLVATQSRWATGGAPAVNIVDIYRLDRGRIVEHWDVIQDRGGT
jgi:predicted SnoaL-like aldol condensation-catalyzing enzyme